jgi:hypothetical protein
MVGVLGLIEEPETEREKADLQDSVKAYWDNFHRDGIERYRDDLTARVGPITPVQTKSQEAWPEAEPLG